MRRERGIFSSVLFGFLTWPAFSQNKLPEKLPGIDEILPAFVKKCETDSLFIGENFTHEEWETTDEIKDGIMVGREQKMYLVMKQNGHLYRKLVSKNWNLVDDSKFEPKEELVSFNAHFFQRFSFSLEREEVSEGNRYWVLLFKPRKNFPEEKLKDRVINNLSGEVWIEQKTRAFKQLTAHLTKEIKYAAPGFTGGKAKKIECVVRAVSIYGHFAVSYVRTEYQYSVSVFFIPINKHSIKTIEYQKYERRTK